jgi:hypothetical protein
MFDQPIREGGHFCFPFAVPKGTSFLASVLCLLAGENTVLSQSGGSEQFVGVSANIVVWSYDLTRSGTNVVTQPNAFPVKCVVGLRRWWIETHFVPNSIATYYFDGSNVYSGEQIIGGWSEETKKALAARPTPFSEPSDTVKSIRWITISPTSDPAGNLGVNLPWLAFCSGDFLRQAGRIIPLPVTIARAMRDAYAYVDKTTTFEDELGLPTTAKLFFSTNQFERSAQYARLGRQTRTYRTQTMPDGQLKFRYEVGHSTNVLGWHFPVTFHFVQYAYDEQGSWRPRYEGQGQALSFVPTGKPGNVFQAGRQQIVRDYRFRSDDRAVDFIAYDTTNGAPLATNAEHLQALFQKRLAESLPANSSGGSEDGQGRR